MAKTQVVNQTTTSTNVPEYARPYLEDALSKAQGYTNAPYIPYGYETSKTEVDPKTGQPLVVAKQGIDPRTGQEYGTRLAGFTDEQKRVQADVMGMQQPGQFGSANTAMQSGLDALARVQNYDPARFYADQAGAERVSSPTLQQYQMQGPQQFGQAQADQYMSPYFQNVVDTQKREAITDAQKAQLTQNMGAARQGTYGGSRQLLATTERERALGQQLGNIQATGLQSAYENAQSQFERDRAAQLGVGTTNLNALIGVQGLGAETGLRAAQGNQQAGLQATLANQQQNLEAQRLGEASRQFGSNLGLQGAQAYGQMGQTYSNIGSAQQQANLQRMQAQANVGGQLQAQNQAGLDIAYGDFQRQQAYPMDQLNQYSGIIRGFDVKPNTTTTTYGQAPSTLSQVGGLGVGALSLYNMAKGA